MVGERYEPKPGDTIEDMLLYFEMQRLKYLKVLEFVKKLQENCASSLSDSGLRIAIHVSTNNILKEIGESAISAIEK